MLKVLHPNRWFFWAISIVVITFVFLWGQVTLYAAEIDQDIAVTLAGYREPLLGSLSWKIDDKGKIYISTTFGLDVDQKRLLVEATHPTSWIVNEKSSHIYFSNRSHQCVLTIGSNMQPTGSYLFVEEKIVSTDRGDIKLNIYKNENTTSAQKYLVQPAKGGVQEIKGNHIFGLVRVSDPGLCAGTFGKILSTVKFAEAPGI